MDFLIELENLIDRAVQAGVGADEIASELELKAQALRDEMVD